MLMMTGRERPAIIEALAPGYARLFERTIAVLAADERVRTVWLSGSVARGDADIASDLDFIVTVADEAHASFAGEWRSWLAAITDTLLAKPLTFAPGSFHAVTPDWLRVDVILERTSDLERSPFRTRIAVFDRDGLAERLVSGEPVRGPSRARLASLVEEFLRMYGLLPVVAFRRDWLAGLVGVHQLREVLYELFVEAGQPHAVTGAKKRSVKLSAEYRRVLESLPTGEANRDAIVGAHLALLGAFRAHAPAICERFDVEWPSRLERATLAHVERQLAELEALREAG